jgi:hypothetical protein
MRPSDWRPVPDTRALLREVIQTKAGSTAKFGVWRDGKLETIKKVRDAQVSAPDDVLKSVETERQQRRPFVPMPISSAGGRRWVAFGLN